MLDQLVECLLVAEHVISGREFRPGIGELHCGEAGLFPSEWPGLR